MLRFVGVGEIPVARPTASARTLRFGAFEVDLRTEELKKDGIRLRMRSQSFQVLRMLLERPGDLVTREELRQKLWPSDTFVDFDHGLNAAVNRLREGLGDSAEHPTYIETLPRLGYRFMGEVQGTAVVEEQAGPNQSAIATDNRPEMRFSHKPALWFSAVVASGILGWLALRGTFHPPRLLGGIQITNDGRPKCQGYVGPLLLTDSSRIYTVEQAEGRTFELVQAPASGGETASIATPFPRIQITDLDRQRSELLVVNWPDEKPELESPLWEYSLLNGSYARVGDLQVSDASWSADGSQIFYTRGTELWSAKRDGTQARLLASLPRRPIWPRESPDGRSVRFTMADPKSASTALWAISYDGSKAHELLPGWSKPPRECCGSWTPDGRYFIFQSLRQGRWGIWVLREKPSLISRLSPGPFPLTNGPIDYVAPAVSSDGKKLFVVGIQARGEVMRYDSEKKQFIPSFHGISAEGLDFSRDGKWVTYVSFPEGQLWRSRSDGSERQQLTFAPLVVTFPRWSPDGSQIAFMAMVPGKPWKIYLVNATGGTPRELLSESVNENDPTWSSDSNSLTFGRLVGGTQSSAVRPAIYTVNLRTQKLSIVPGSEGLFSPRWSLDGSYLAALSADSQHLMLHNVARHDWTELANGGVSYPRWSHDNKYIYYDTLGKDRFVNRVDIKTGAIERIASLENLRTTGALGSWSGLGPDDSILFLRDAGKKEVYSFELDLP